MLIESCVLLSDFPSRINRNIHVIEGRVHRNIRDTVRNPLTGEVDCFISGRDDSNSYVAVGKTPFSTYWDTPHESSLRSGIFDLSGNGRLPGLGNLLCHLSVSLTEPQGITGFSSLLR
jgi:hypothetical protein